MTPWLPLIVFVVGGLTLLGLVLSVLKVDESWTSRYWACCRCTYTWTGRSKICERCLGRGRADQPPPERKTPAYDWQGHMDTGPIRVITKEDPDGEVR